MSDSEKTAPGSGAESSAEYLEKVEQELRRREQVVARLTREVGVLEFKLSRRQERRKFLDGNASKLSSAESYRRQLRLQLAKYEKELAAARQEVEKARERRDMIRSEMQAALKEGGPQQS